MDYLRRYDIDSATARKDIRSSFNRYKDADYGWNGINRNA